jgi:hypothetical protein
LDVLAGFDGPQHLSTLLFGQPSISPKIEQVDFKQVLLGKIFLGPWTRRRLLNQAGPAGLAGRISQFWLG